MADTRKGNRPSFTDAAPPEEAEPLVERSAEAVRADGFHIETGFFGAYSCQGGTIRRVEERPQLRAITDADRPVIERLWQLYSHDMSEVRGELLRLHPGSWEIGFQAKNDGAPEFWRRVATDAVGNSWREELRPVPGKPRIPHDHFIVFDV